MAAKEVSAAMEEVSNEVVDEPEDEMSRKSTKDAADPTPTALPAEVLESDDADEVRIERALHLRVLAGILGGQADDGRVEQALQLAQEVYELEIASAASLENYRSAGNAPEQ
jgi:hypothetical protein